MVRVFVRDTSSSIGWTQQGSDIIGDASGDLFGFTIALSSDGNILVAGALYGNSDDSGYVKVYKRDTSSPIGWSQLGGKISGAESDDRSSLAVDVSGDGLLIGIGSYTNDDGGEDAGHVRLFNEIYQVFSL